MTQLTLIKADWIEDVAPRVVLLARSLRTFTTDDLHAKIQPEPENRNWWGVLMAKLKGKGLIRRVGYQPSTRPEANGRPIAVWEVVG